MIRSIIELLQLIETEDLPQSERIDIAIGKYKLPSNWKEAKLHWKNRKEWQ